MNQTITIAWRNIWRNKRRTILCVVAVAIAVFFNIFMDSWIDGMYKSIEDVVRTFETGHVTADSALFERDKEYFPVQYPLLDGADASEIESRAEAIPGVKVAVSRITVYASLFDSTVKHALVWGIEVKRELGINDFNLTDRTDGMVTGRYPESGKNECAVGTAFAKKAGLGIGDPIPMKLVSSQFSDKYWSPVITGIYEFDYSKFDRETIIVPIDRLQKILGLGAGTQQLLVYADDERETPRIASELSVLLGGDSVVREWTDNYWVAMLRSMSWMYVVIFGVFQIVASFLIINTMLMVIHERIKEIGMMGALGMNRREIVLVFFLEAVFLSVLGAAAGACIGAIGTWIGSLYPLDMTTFTGGGMKDLPVSGTLTLGFSWLSVAQGFLFGVVVSSACTLIPSLKSAFVEPVEALRR